MKCAISRGRNTLRWTIMQYIESLSMPSTMWSVSKLLALNHSVCFSRPITHIHASNASVMFIISWVFLMDSTNFTSSISSTDESEALRGLECSRTRWLFDRHLLKLNLDLSLTAWRKEAHERPVAHAHTGSRALRARDGTRTRESGVECARTPQGAGLWGRTARLGRWGR